MIAKKTELNLFIIYGVFIAAREVLECTLQPAKRRPQGLTHTRFDAPRHRLSWFDNQQGRGDVEWKENTSGGPKFSFRYQLKGQLMRPGIFACLEGIAGYFRYLSRLGRVRDGISDWMF